MSLRRAIHFFVSYNQMEGRQFKPIGCAGPGRAEHLAEDGIRLRRQGDKSGDRATARAKK